MTPRNRQPSSPSDAAHDDAPGSSPLADDGEPAWEPVPGGPALSASGALLRPCSHCGAARDSEEGPCARCGARPHSAAFALKSAATAPLPPPPADEPLLLAEDHRATRAESTDRSVLDTPGGALELEARAPRPESTWDVDPTAPARTRRRWGGLVVALCIAALLAGTGAWLWQRLHLQVEKAMRGGGNPMLTIRSEPDGATVLVDGVSVGTTPLMMDNVYPDHPIPVQLKLKGYRTWKGTFTGAEPVDLNVRLQR
ncbi:PEGA domain-containing protein [Myxococcaceae bacterium JPH2]|nr:PEGA domain-containing protein [Myxococcaceae bacterium JPH2]